jgi:hypothetical protein
MTDAQTSLQLADHVLAGLTRWTLMNALAQSRVPSLSDRENEYEHCPKCGRRLPFTFGQLSGGGLAGTMVIEHPEHAYVAACLVDGPRSTHARPFTSGEIVDASGAVADGLERARWRGWARLVRRATTDGSIPEDDRLEMVGQALEALRVYGPLDRTPAGQIANSALDVLVASTGRYWRPRMAPDE